MELKKRLVSDGFESFEKCAVGDVVFFELYGYDNAWARFKFSKSENFNPQNKCLADKFEKTTKPTPCNCTEKIESDFMKTQRNVETGIFVCRAKTDSEYLDRLQVAFVFLYKNGHVADNILIPATHCPFCGQKYEP